MHSRASFRENHIMRNLECLIPPPVVFAFCAAAMWGVAQYFEPISLPQPWAEWAMFGLIAAGVLLDFSSIMEFLKERTTINPIRIEKATALVTTGFYRITRNPMYSGLALWLGAFAIYLQVWESAPLIVVFMLYITRFQIIPEERMMSKQFGDRYLAYTHQVRRWL